MNIATRRHLSRRAFLRGVGVTLTLPWLDAMRPAFAGSASSAPRRFVSLCFGLGFHAPNIIPEQAGRGYAMPFYLKPFEDLRDDLTIVSGTSHPDVGGAHSSESSFLTAAPFPGTPLYRQSVSLDQLMAERLGTETRFPSLVLSSSGLSSSYTRSGSMIPADTSPSMLYAKLFIDGTPAEQQQQIKRIKQGRSIMDLVGEDSKRLQRDLGPGDRDKLDAYFTNIRDLEKQLASNQGWAGRPKPHPSGKAPTDVTNSADLAGRERAMLEVMALALQTDSTRFLTLHLTGGAGVPPIKGVTEGHHNLSHHGQDPHKIEQLALIEQDLMLAWADFLRRLKQTAESDASLLDHTVVLLGSNLGNASSHNTKNMPILLAGGGFKHGTHIAFDKARNAPSANLYVSVMHRLGVEQDKFVSSTGTLAGLAMA